MDIENMVIYYMIHEHAYGTYELKLKSWPSLTDSAFANEYGIEQRDISKRAGNQRPNIYMNRRGGRQTFEFKHDTSCDAQLLCPWLTSNKTELALGNHLLTLLAFGPARGSVFDAVCGFRHDEVASMVISAWRCIANFMSTSCLDYQIWAMASVAPRSLVWIW